MIPTTTLHTLALDCSGSRSSKLSILCDDQSITSTHHEITLPNRVAKFSPHRILGCFIRRRYEKTIGRSIIRQQDLEAPRFPTKTEYLGRKHKVHPFDQTCGSKFQYATSSYTALRFQKPRLSRFCLSLRDSEKKDENKLIRHRYLQTTNCRIIESS